MSLAYAGKVFIFSHKRGLFKQEQLLKLIPIKSLQIARNKNSTNESSRKVRIKFCRLSFPKCYLRMTVSFVCR